MCAKVNNPHDAFFKKYYEQPATAAGFLKYNLPADVAACIDFETLEPAQESFLADGLEHFFADLVFSCALTDGRSGQIYILLEHKSVPSPACALQILRYMVMLWERETADATPWGNLSVVIPIVIYHGKKPWDVKSIRELIPHPPPLGGFIPDYRLLVYDLSHMEEGEIKGDIAAKAGMLLLRAMSTNAPLSKVMELVALLLGALGPQSATKTIEQFFRYVMSVRPNINREQLVHELSRIPEGDAIMRNITAELSPEAFQDGMVQGIEKGIEKGMEKGMVQGRQEALYNALASLLRARFTAVPTRVMQKCKAIDDSQLLNQLCVAVLHADSIEAFETAVDKALE
jgi:predicted transposase/invertase (TIGR01784 family)